MRKTQNSDTLMHLGHRKKYAYDRPLKHNALHGEAMTPFFRRPWILPFLAVLGVLLLIFDQAVKFWIKLNMSLGESIEVTSWFQILFVENEGMAYGIEIGSKLLLTLFRIIVMGLFCWGFVAIVRRGTYKIGFLIALLLIFVGGIGNIIDSVFYGVIFSESPAFGAVATLFPADGGYAPLFYGRVVDMLYFPLIDAYWPEWMPFVGGQHFTFFDPIFNFADSYITIGVLMLLLFYMKSLSQAFAQMDQWWSSRRKSREMKKSNS